VPCTCARSAGIAHRFPAVAVDDADALRRELARGSDDMCKQRSSGQRMQHFREIRVHALALAGGEYDDVHGMTCSSG